MGRSRVIQYFTGLCENLVVQAWSRLLLRTTNSQGT